MAYNGCQDAAVVGLEAHGRFGTVSRELRTWTRDDADRMWSWGLEADAAVSIPEADQLYAIFDRAECCPESITMTIPCPIFRLRTICWLILALIIVFSTTVAVYAELIFSFDSVLIPAMWLGSMALVLGIRDWSLFYIGMDGWMFAGLWLVLQVAHLMWLL
ncbi:MAG: hypothetical protein OXH72_13410 [Caldilineaceae bacterium]|nr:hypothetical protein [Caldilineaceae bacterium]